MSEKVTKGQVLLGIAGEDIFSVKFEPPVHLKEMGRAVTHHFLIADLTPYSKAGGKNKVSHIKYKSTPYRHPHWGFSSSRDHFVGLHQKIAKSLNRELIVDMPGLMPEEEVA